MYLVLTLPLLIDNLFLKYPMPLYAISFLSLIHILWLRYNQKSAISSNEWAELQVQAMPKLVGGLFLGVKYSKDGTNVAMAAASRTDDGRIFVECIDCRPTRAGNSWMIPFMMNPNVYDIVVDLSLIHICGNTMEKKHKKRNSLKNFQS